MPPITTMKMGIVQSVRPNEARGAKRSFSSVAQPRQARQRRNQQETDDAHSRDVDAGGPRRLLVLADLAATTQNCGLGRRFSPGKPENSGSK
ncbi:MAG: hypothetical protein ACLPN5_15830 [Roseiarcus sp.]